MELEECFAGLTGKQQRVLELLLENYTTKEMAKEIGLSPSSIDHRIDRVRRRAGCATRSELAKLYRTWRSSRENSAESPARPVATAGENFTCEFLSLQDVRQQPLAGFSEAHPGRFSFADAAALDRQIAWRREVEPGGIRKLLDGKDAVWFRLLAILAMTVLIIASTILALTAAQTLSEIFCESRLAQQESPSLPASGRGTGV